MARRTLAQWRALAAQACVLSCGCAAQVGRGWGMSRVATWGEDGAKGRVMVAARSGLGHGWCRDANSGSAG